MISIIVAHDENRVIGGEGKIPWDIPEDLKRFKKLTSGHSIIMGRATHESIGRALPKRLNIVLSLKVAYEPHDKAVRVKRFSDALELAKQSQGFDEVFIIGGESVYADALKIADRIYATEVAGKHPGDAYFPEIEREEWKRVVEESHPATEGTPEYQYVRYERV